MTMLSCDAVRECRLEHRVVTDIGFHGHDAAIERLDLSGGFRQVLAGSGRVASVDHLVAHVHGYDVGTFLGEPHGMGPALTARRTSYEGDFILQMSGHFTVTSWLADGAVRRRRVAG